MTPTWPVPFLGVNLPIIPIPVAFPALPECLMDDLVAFLDKVNFSFSLSLSLSLTPPPKSILQRVMISSYPIT